jgi:hypothetical protein
MRKILGTFPYQREREYKKQGNYALDKAER